MTTTDTRRDALAFSEILRLVAEVSGDPAMAAGLEARLREQMRGNGLDEHEREVLRAWCRLCEWSVKP